jgi:hypothetical protein
LDRTAGFVSESQIERHGSVESLIDPNIAQQLRPLGSSQERGARNQDKEEDDCMPEDLTD